MPAQRGVVALLQDAGPQPPPVRHTQPVRFSLPSAVEQAATNDEGAACRALCGRRHRVTTAVHGAPHGGCRAFEDGAKEGVGGELPAPRATKLGDKKWRSGWAVLGDTVMVHSTRGQAHLCTCAPASGVKASWRPGGPCPDCRPAAAAGRTAAPAAAAVAVFYLNIRRGGQHRN